MESRPEVEETIPSCRNIVRAAANQPSPKTDRPSWVETQQRDVWPNGEEIVETEDDFILFYR